MLKQSQFHKGLDEFQEHPVKLETRKSLGGKVNRGEDKERLGVQFLTEP